ncbi:IS1634 family transposase [Leekyejoonella antrihumi]|uniref:IS1634 family transposase n=1 Tax=Leekyejoonella antrihumi TaxID=1660198 RepID=A0A563DNP1_9MICO|nr:IS1634 family transposase [Leekyejoonella antrihumi]TWP31876.1 IS1634 family transposase [Leekyejoonella antrihumi]
MVFLRKVRTASGATAVQIAQRVGGRDKVIEHLGSAHDDAQLAVLMEAGRRKLHAGQGELELGLAAQGFADAVVQGQTSRILVDVVRQAWQRLGFDVIVDDAFFQLVLARLVEPTSKADSVRVLAELGVRPAHRNTFTATMKRCSQRGYRDQIATACFAHAAAAGDISLCLYDVTTLYFEAEHEDALRKVGFSKERRVDPQVVVGLLVDRNGFPLEIGCFEGNKAEKLTIVPIVAQFIERHNLADLVVVADAGMLSATNLKALDEANLRFIVGSRTTKAPIDLESHFRWHGDAFDDGQVIDTITPKSGKHRRENDTKLKAEPVWDPDTHEASWRAVWAYSHKRAVRDRKTLGLQEDKARAIVAGEKAAHATRFVKAGRDGRVVDEASLARAWRLVGLKGYVTNLPAEMMPAAEVIANYHDLWHVEQSFRMSKTDLAARPMFHHQRDSIEAHLTIVFTALAVARHLQDATGLSIRRIVQTLRPLRDVEIKVAGQTITAHPQIPATTQTMLDSLTH